MASWIIHLRVAEQIYQRLNIKPINEFVLGNIAPDSGVPADDGTGFIPSASISHFRTIDENGIKCIHEDLFIRKYFSKERRLLYTPEEHAFFLGYLTHLITDKIWAREIVYDAKEQFHSLFLSDRALFWKMIKTDWYDLDFMYLKANPSFEAFQIYQKNPYIKNTYIDIFAKDAFEKRRVFILDFYAKGVANVAERATYLSQKDLDRFVASADEEILHHSDIGNSPVTGKPSRIFPSE